MTEAATVRLSKAAKEFNVGMSTITDFLKKKGFNIENSPNFKLTPEMYQLVETEYMGYKKIKSKADAIDLSFQPTNRDTSDSKSKKKAQTSEKKADKRIDTDINSNNETVAPQEDNDIFTPSKLRGPVIVDTIDLDNINKKNSANKQMEEEKERQRLEEEEKERKRIAEEERQRLEAEMKEKQRIEAEERQRLESEERERQRIEAEAKEKQRIEAEERQRLEAEIKEKQRLEKIAEQTQMDSKAEKEKKEASTTTVKKDQNDENFIKVEVERLTGPKIISKIELPVEKAKPSKPQQGTNNEDNKKKKRKRITKEFDKVATSKASGNIKKEDTPFVKKDKDKENKDNAAKKPHNNNPKKKKEVKKVVVSDEEVKKQIHETLSHLEQKGKSKTVKRRKEKRIAKDEEMRRIEAKREAEQSILKVTEFVTVNELATLMNVPVTNVIKICMDLGVIVSINQRLDAETLVVVAEEFGFQVEFVGVELNDVEEEIEEDEADRVTRNPIVTVMGHVDHGKTSLLDYIRNTNVIAGEAGGITQHVGAYEVHLDNGRNITFLDTPGHEAFTAMRARGAQITDVVIVVVAADDKVMPQTIEAINHAQAASVPIIIAINKIDKPTADVEKIKRELSTINILVEDWGGPYQCQEISAKKGTNVDLLLEKVLLEADILDLKGNPNKRAEGTVIESELDKGRGYMSKILVQDGTLHIGDIVLAGTCYGKVKAMFNERNQKVATCGPSSPIALLGLNGAPQAGDKFIVFSDEHEAKSVANKRSQLQRELGIRTQKHITLEEIGRRIAIGDFKELNIIIKADVDGSVEALTDSLIKLSTPEVQVNIIHKSVGQITETDVTLAAASDAIIVGFQVRPSNKARELAEKDQIDIRTYSVIYKVIDEIKDAIEGMLSPEFEEKIVCNVEVREVYKISKVGTIAGCFVQNGTISRNTNIRVIRDGVVIHSGRLGSLKRFKDDVKEVRASLECGLNIDNFNDIQIGDIIEGFEEVKRQKK